MFFIFSSSLILLWLGYGLTHFIDHGFRSYEDLVRCIEILGVAIGLRAISSYGELFFTSLLAEKVGVSLRQALFQKLLTFNSEFYEKNTVGDLLSSLVYDISLVEVVITNTIPLFGRNLLIALGGTILLFMSNHHLALIVVCSFPLVLIPLLFFDQWGPVALSQKLQKKWTSAAAHAEEALAGIKTVQAFGQEDLEKKKFTKELQAGMKDSFYRLRLKGMIAFISIAIGFCGVGFVLWLGGEEVLSHEMSSGKLTAFVFYALAVVSYLGYLGEGWGDLESGKVAASTLNAFLEKNDQIPLSVGPRKKEQKGEGISFKEVTFFHPDYPDRKILNKATFDIPYGQTAVLLGASGSGKTTIFELLMRFYDPEEGEICLKGTPIQSLSLEDLRSDVGIVSQDSVVFSGTIYENISYGANGVTKADVVKAAKVTGVSDFSKEFPDGIHSYVGHRGMLLSSGQRQRIVMARILMKDPEFLLFDEPVNFLSTGREIFDWLIVRKKKNQTTLVIAHHLSTVQQADLVVVLKEGTVLETGTHKALLKKSKFYRNLVNVMLVKD